MERHAWHMSDNTIQLWGVGQTVEHIVTWTVPPEFGNLTAYKLNSADLLSLPYPRVSWIAADNKEVVRFQCGPTTALCYSTLKAPVPLPIMPNFYVQSIKEVNYNNAVTLLLTHPGGVVRIEEKHLEIVVLDSLNWANSPWFQKFPVSRIRGAVRTYAGINNQLRGRLTVPISPAGNVTGVGLIVNLEYDLKGHRVKQVTMMPQAVQNFAAHEKNTGDGLIYYWLMQTPFTDRHTKNAFILSHGGSAQNPLQYASTTFDPGIHWSSEVFLFDKGETVPTRDVGMIVSGNETMSLWPGAHSGFDVWTPKYSYGYSSPEVELGTSLRVESFGMPVMANNVFGEFVGSSASMATRGWSSEIGKADYPCWYYVILNWNFKAPTQAYEDKIRSISTDYFLEARKGNTGPTTSTDYYQGVLAAVKDVPLNYEKYAANDEFKVTEEIVDHKASIETRRAAKTDLFAANCRVSNCDIDEAGDCPIGRCWARGAIGGFQCCEHPPV